MKRKFLKLLLGLFLFANINAQPPNNAIFRGGVGDGFSVASNEILSNNIFFGGVGDGISNASNTGISNNIFFGGVGDGFTNGNNAAVSNNIFFGGIGDGFSNANNTAVSNSIFKGGAGDGWTNETNSAIPNTIFRGGQGDGWSSLNNISLANNIFFGGAGDGWSAVVVPLGPLPVTILSFNGEQINKQHVLSWQTSNEINASHFELQRSAKGNNFVALGDVQASGQNGSVNNYSFVDAIPLEENNFYRLKQLDNDGKFVYSNIILLRLLKDKAILSVYPNPTADVLNIALIGSYNGSKLQIEVFDMNGKKLNSTVFTNGSSVVKINVSTFAKGVYTLFINDNGETSSIKFVKQ